MRRISLIASFALALGACGAPSEDASPVDDLERPPRKFFVWNDPSVASGNLDADYSDCKAQLASDPAITDTTPKLAMTAANIRCMEPKGWKFVMPDAPAHP